MTITTQFVGGFFCGDRIRIDPAAKDIEMRMGNVRYVYRLEHLRSGGRGPLVLKCRRQYRVAEQVL